MGQNFGILPTTNHPYFRFSELLDTEDQPEMDRYLVRLPSGDRKRFYTSKYLQMLKIIPA